MKINFTTLFLIVFSILYSCKPSVTQEAQNGINSNDDNIAPIKFSTSDLRDTTQTTAFKDQFNLNLDKYLNIHFTLDEPLITALRKIDEVASDETLIQNGNFRFNFIVDGEEVYNHNLHPGAGWPKDKLNRKEYDITLLYPESLDYWGWYLWLRFMKMGGGEDVLAEGVHTLKIEIQTYYTEDETKKGNVIASGEVDVNVKEIPHDIEAVKVKPISKNSGWALSESSFDKSKIETMNKKIAQNRFVAINGVVVIKDEKLLIEEYYNGENRESLHDSRSVGKTIASTMMGIAIKEGYLNDENLKLKEFYDLKNFENYDPLKEEVTLKSLLTMSSNILGNDDDYDSPGNEEKMYLTEDWVKFTLDLPIDKNKTMENDFDYLTAGIVVLGDVIDKSVPGGLVNYTDEKFFKPLGITKRNWQFTPQNVGNTAGGLQLRAVDFAKWGKVYKNKGQWKGQQLIPEKWVEKSLAHQVNQEGIENGTYGYLFWNNIYTVDGKEYAYSTCSGNGGNKIYIFKNLPLVIVITASAYGMPFAHMQVDQMMERYILPAVID